MDVRQRGKAVEGVIKMGSFTDREAFVKVRRCAVCAVGDIVVFEGVFEAMDFLVRCVGGGGG